MEISSIYFSLIIALYVIPSYLCSASLQSIVFSLLFWPYFYNFNLIPALSEIKMHIAMCVASKIGILLSVITFNLELNNKTKQSETNKKQTKYSLSVTLKYFSTMSCHISCLFTLWRNIFKSTDHSTFCFCFFFL